MKKVIQYVQVSGMKEARLIASALENEAIPTIAAPPHPPQVEDPNNPGQFLPEDPNKVEIWQEEIKMTAKRRQSLHEGLEWLYAILMGQCAPSCWSKVEGTVGFEQINNTQDPVALKGLIKRTCCGFQAHQQPVYSMVQAMKALHTCYQERESNKDWKKKLEAMFTIIEQYGGSASHRPRLIEERAVEIAAGDGRLPEEVDRNDRAMAEALVTEEIKAA
jgi:hypothetical protein